MSVSVTSNDLGSMGAPSSDTALAPLIAALTSNTTVLGSSTTKLTALEAALDKLQTVFANITALSTGINALRVGVERLTATLSSKSSGGVKRGQNLVPAEGSSGMPVKAMPPGSMQSDNNPSVVFIEKASKKRESEEEKAIRIETEANLRNASELVNLEEKWLKREYDDRKKYQKKKIANDEKESKELHDAIVKGVKEGGKKYQKEKFEKGMKYGPTREEFEVAKQKEKENNKKAQYQPTQEAHVEAYKRDRELKESITKGIAESGKKYQKEKFEKGMAYGPSRIDYLVGKEKEKEAQSKPKQEAHVEAFNREKIANMEALAAVDAINKKESEAIKAAAEEASARAMWRDGLNKILEMRIAADKELHRTDRGGPGGPGGPSGPGGSKGGGGGGTSPGGMGSFSGSPVAQAGMALFSAINMAISGFNKLHSAVESLAKSAMTYAPGIAIGMERALKDLDAVVGSYSAQVGASMIPLVRTIADYMFPAMLALGNAVSLVVQSLIPFATAIMQAVMPIVTLVANTFSLLWKAMSPLIDFLGAIFSFIGIIIGAFAGVLQGNIDLLSDVFSYIQPLFSLFATTVSQAIEMFRQLVITITSWIPYVGAAVKKALTPQSTQGLAAASTAKYGNAQSLGEAAAQNAFIATSGKATPQEEFAQQMIDNDIPNKWGMALDAQGRPVNIAVRKDDGFVGEGGGGNWDDAPQGKPLHGKNNAPIRMGM
jgi:hypothetical protein